MERRLLSSCSEGCGDQTAKQTVLGALKGAQSISPIVSPFVRNAKQKQYLEGFRYNREALLVDSRQTELDILKFSTIEPAFSLLLEPCANLAR